MIKKERKKFLIALKRMVKNLYILLAVIFTASLYNV